MSTNQREVLIYSDAKNPRNNLCCIVGQLFASLGVVAGASDMFAGTMLDLIYSATYKYYAGTVFLIIGAAYMVDVIAFA